MATYFGITINDIFKTQSERFRKDDAAGVDAVFAYDISGDGGGQWKVTVKDLTAKTETVDDGNYGKFSVKMITDAETFAGITVGKIDGTQAFMGGKVKVEGDMSLMMVLPKLFTKFVAPKKGVTAADIIATMPERFRPDKAEGLDILIGYDLPGEGGGQWTAKVKDGKVEIVEGLLPNLTVSNIVKANDYVDLMTGKLDPLVAIGAGRLRLTGDMEIAKILTKIFGKFVVKDAEVSEEFIILKKIVSVDMDYATGPVMGRFFDELKKKKITANVCPKCGRKQLPPREICAECRCRADEFVEVGPEGRINLFELVYYASPDPLTGETRETPYGTIHILLDGCQQRETFWHFLKKEDLFKAKRGDRVRPIWNDNPVGDVNDILYFELV
jgi:uncharacterized OB-fold protein/putative sterol carrier protein